VACIQRWQKGKDGVHASAYKLILRDILLIGIKYLRGFSFKMRRVVSRDFHEWNYAFCQKWQN
jgi:hypothetical protein